MICTAAERVFTFYPFEPDPFPANWRDILRCWLLGQPLAAIVAGQEAEALQFIEGGLVYRLPWAMEALRVRAAANGDVVGMFALALDDYELGLAVPAVETGTMNRSASILIQAGFNSRLARNCARGCAHPASRSGRRNPTGQRPRRGPYGSNSSRSSPRQTIGPGPDGIILETSSGSPHPRLPEHQSASFIGTDSRWCWRPTGTRSVCYSTRSTRIGAVLCERLSL